MAKATYFVDRAKAETRYQFDEQDAAVAIIAPYAYGEKPEEVEVWMEEGVSRVSPCTRLLRQIAAAGT